MDNNCFQNNKPNQYFVQLYKEIPNNIFKNIRTKKSYEFCKFQEVYALG